MYTKKLGFQERLVYFLPMFNIAGLIANCEDSKFWNVFCWVYNAAIISTVVLLNVLRR